MIELPDHHDGVGADALPNHGITFRPPDQGFDRYRVTFRYTEFRGRLRVDDARGKTLTTEMLSSGTREQVFLSLRLALVTLYAQRGVNLPLVLDDVLVNFDETRARAAS